MITIRISISTLKHAILPAFLLVLALAFLIAGSTPANAASTIYYSVLAETFSPVDSSIGFNNFDAFLTTTANSTVNPGESGYYIGHVSLPDGATITGLRCSGYDTDSTQEFKFFLYRYSIDNPTNPYDLISYPGPSGLEWNFGKTTVIPAILTTNGKNVVNNSTWAYGIYLALPKASTSTQLKVLSCRVDATYPVNLAIVR